jgi:hypothetical protein
MKRFFDFLQATTQEWIDNGTCSDAVTLNDAMSEPFFDTANPHFFTGDINAKLVMVQLNPKRDRAEFNKKATHDFEFYLDYYSNYGKFVYGKKSTKLFKSKFDQKLIRFLRPLDIIDLNDDDVFQNLENVVDQKLQIEFIPFGSPSFDYNIIPSHFLKKHLENILCLISSTKRSCVIFGGRVFSLILSPYIKERRVHRFKLQKTNGEISKNEYEIEKVKIYFEDKSFTAFVAPHFAIQGMPVEAYGRKLKELMSNN